MKKPDDAEFRKRLLQAVERFKAYISAGQSKAVIEVLSARNLSDSTIRSWINDPGKVEGGYRRYEFVEAILSLSDLDKQRRNDAYEFALRESEAARSGQRDILSYRGNYRAYHNFEGIQLNFLAIRVEEEPFVAIFALKYHNRFQRRSTCDGLILSRHGQLLFAGLSPTTSFQAVFDGVAQPAKEPIRGMAFLHDVSAKQLRFSKMVICRDPTSQAESEAKAYISSP